MEFQELQALKTLAEHKNSAEQAAIFIEGAAVTSTNTDVSGKVRIEVLGTGQSTKAVNFRKNNKKAFNPLPYFQKIMLQFFPENVRKKLSKGPKSAK